jgi:hypothetical protein
MIKIIGVSLMILGIIMCVHNRVEGGIVSFLLGVLLAREGDDDEGLPHGV